MKVTMKGFAYLPVFLAGANSANYEVRYKSINNLGTDTYASREVSAVIRSATSDPVGVVRQVAIESLVDGGGSASLGTVEGSADGTAGETMALLMTLLSDRDAGIRSTAVETLSRTQTSDPAVIAALVKHLKDPDYNVRTAAAKAMGVMKISTPEVIAALVVCLKDPDRYTVKEAAANALGEIGKPANAAAPALLAIYQESRRISRSKGENPDSDFAVAVYWALVKMGEPPPEDTP
jgi:HEAT repeat protein